MVLLPYYAYKVQTAVPVTEVVEALKEVTYLTDRTFSNEKPYFGRINFEGFELKTTFSTGGPNAIISGKFVKPSTAPSTALVTISVKIRAPWLLYLFLIFFVFMLTKEAIMAFIASSDKWILYVCGVLFVWTSPTAIFYFHVKEFKRILNGILKGR